MNVTVEERLNALMGKVQAEVEAYKAEIGKVEPVPEQAIESEKVEKVAPVNNKEQRKPRSSDQQNITELSVYKLEDLVFKQSRAVSEILYKGLEKKIHQAETRDRIIQDKLEYVERLLEEFVIKGVRQ